MPPAISVANRLLRALSPDDLDPLRAHLETVPLPQKQTLSSSGTSIDHVYFPQEGMVSLVQPLEDGTTIEVGMIGNEGLVGNAGPPRCG
jgi:CRP-like cAMP-binding protein